MNNGGNGGAGCYSRDGNFYIYRFPAEGIETKLQRIDSKPLKSNCPNCGAPITGPACEYCGTIFDLQAVKDRANEQRRFADAEQEWQNAMNALKTYSVQQTLTMNDVYDIERLSAIVKSTTSRMERFRGI